MATKNDGLLYHYTSNAGLIGILTTGHIWMSDPRFLNDSQEWYWAGKIVAKTIKGFARNFKQSDMGKCWEKANYNKFIRRLINHFKDMPISSYRFDPQVPFIFSLSEINNSLSQWRAYGKGEYCIAFNAEKLASIYRTDLIKVNYDKLKYDPKIANVVEEFFNNHRHNVYGTPDASGNLELEVMDEGVLELQAKLHGRHFLLAKKHPDFHEEKEWRLVTNLHSGRSPDKRVFFDSATRYPTPRAKVRIFQSPMSDPAAEEKLQPHERRPTLNEIIHHVVCGPGADETMAKASFEMLKSFAGINVPLEISGTPFRG